MTKNSVWKKGQKLQLQISDNILPELNIGFDKQIPNDVENQLRSFVSWLEQNYRFPITLWIDFEYKHYLIDRSGRRVGYLFYWSDFSDYPYFNNIDDIPQIRLPVRTEHSTIEEILTSFIEAITDYYAWICKAMCDEYVADADDVEEVLRAYLNSCD